MSNSGRLLWLFSGFGILLSSLPAESQESGGTIVPGQVEEEEDEPTGVQIGEVQERKSVREIARPQRVPIFQDDPESAWWEVNPHHAFNLAQRLQRPLLLLFTGDWNAKSKKLSEEVFATRSFNDFVNEHVVICYLNYPRNRNDAPDALRRWKEQFKVMGYPNLLVFDPDGNVVQDIVGYTTGRPVTYFNELKGIVLPLVDTIEEQKKELRKKGFRDWSNREGNQLFARFIRHGGGLVTLQGANLETWTIEIDTLSGEDRDLVESFPEVGELSPEKGEVVGP